ncbi:MAG: PD-(D/E)XK motif protein [Galactobacter sp.]
MTDTTSGGFDQSRSLSPEALEDYLAAGVPVVLPHGAGSRHELTIDPVHHEFVLRSLADGTYEDEGFLENIEVELDESGASDQYVLTVAAGDAPDAAYALAYAIVRETDAGRSYAQAVTYAVEQFRKLLRSRRRLSASQETGLIGELSVLLQLIGAIGAEEAVEAWLGPEAEEHDFGLPGYDLEVKTTLSEDRAHVIHGLDQLSPNPNRELHLLSLQFTAAGRGEGESLTQLARRALASAGMQATAVRTALDQVGWREEDADLYSKRYTLRRNPRCYLVDEHFPAITQERINRVIPNAGLIGHDVSYRVNVKPLPYGVPGPELQDFVEEATHE